MLSYDRRAAARRRAWGRGPYILRFEPLEGRQLLSTTDPVASIAAAAGASAATVGPATESAAEAIVDDTNVAATTESAAAEVADDTDIAATTLAALATTTAATTGATTPTTGASGYDGSNLVATAFDSAHNLDWGDAFHVTGAVQNLGSTATTVPYRLDVYASTTPRPGAGSVFLGSVEIPAGVEPGARTDFDRVLTAPPVPLASIGSAQSYYLAPKLVAVGASATASPSAVAGSPLSSVVTITPKVPPKLVGAGLAVAPGSIAWGDTITVTAKVRNDSQGAAPPTNARIVLTPVGKTPGGGSDYQIGQVPVPPIGAYQVASASQKITLPLYAPTALSGTSQFLVTMVQDADATANPLVPPSSATSANDATQLTIATPRSLPADPPPKPAPADLAVVDVQEPSPTMFRGATFPVGATIQNKGAGKAGEFKVRFLLVTDESPDAPALVLGDATIPDGLEPGMQQDVLQTVTLPYRTPDGFSADSTTARIVVRVDPDRKIDQADTSNDTLAAPRVQLKLLTPDGQTTVPILPGGTTTPAASGTGTTTTTTPVAASAQGGSNFETATVAAAAIPTSTTATTTTTTTPATSTPTPPATPTPATSAPAGGKATTRRAAALAKAAARRAAATKAAARKAAVKAERASRVAQAAAVHTQVVATHTIAVKSRAVARSQPLRVFRPASSA